MILPLNPDRPFVVKRTSRFIEEQKIFATKAQRHEGFFFAILS